MNNGINKHKHMHNNLNKITKKYLLVQNQTAAPKQYTWYTVRVFKGKVSKKRLKLIQYLKLLK